MPALGPRDGTRRRAPDEELGTSAGVDCRRGRGPDGARSAVVGRSRRLAVARAHRALSRTRLGYVAQGLLASRVSRRPLGLVVDRRSDLVFLPGTGVPVSESLRAPGRGNCAAGARQSGAATSTASELVLLRIRKGLLPVRAGLSGWVACCASHAGHTTCVAPGRTAGTCALATAVNDRCIGLSGESR